jgi:hypothetical protein
MCLNCFSFKSLSWEFCSSKLGRSTIQNLIVELFYFIKVSTYIIIFFKILAKQKII